LQPAHDIQYSFMGTAADENAAAVLFDQKIVFMQELILNEGAVPIADGQTLAGEGMAPSFRINSCMNTIF